MATIVNTPGNQESSNSGMGMIVGGILFLLALFIFFVYGLPAIRNAATPAQPAGTSIEVPDQIDVNVTNPQQGQ